MAGPGQIDTDVIGSAGTLVAAGLQTAGLHVQEAILRVFEQGLGSHLGLLLYVLSALVALMTIGLGGNYKFGLWFLVGPFLFYQLTIPRVLSKGVEWRFGENIHDTRLVYETVKGVAEGTSNAEIASKGQAATEKLVQGAKVSAVFAQWDIITSNIIQAFVSALQLTDVKSDIDFISKTERYAKLFRLKVDEPDLLKFIQLITLSNTCIQYYGLQQAIADRSRADQKDIEREDMKLLADEIVLTKTDEKYPFLNDLFERGYFGSSDIVTELKEQDEFVCQDLWTLAIEALKIHATQVVNRMADAKRGDTLAAQDVMNDLAKKFDPLNESCGEEEREEACNNRKVVLMINAIAVRMFYESMKEFNPELRQLSLSRHLRKSSEMTNPGDDDDFDVTRDLKFFAASYEYHGKGEFLSAMLAMPYLQGIVLYFLAIAYPFFALTIIVPGRYHTFFLWMGLWFWVKSWDFGFAVVMLVDEVLYMLLPHGPRIEGQDLEEPAKAFQIMLQADPTYTVHMYYNLMGTCIAAVPVISGILVKRGGGEVLHAVKQGFQNFSGKIGNSMASMYRSYRTQQMWGEQQQNVMTALKGKLFDSLRHPEVLLGAAMAGAGKLSQSKLKEEGQFLGRLAADSYANGKVSVHPTAVGYPSSEPGRAFNPNANSAFLNGIAKNLSGRTESYGKDLAAARVKFELASVAWEESLQKKNRELSELGVLLKYYNHDWNVDPPANEALGLAVARMNYFWGGAADAVPDQVLGKARDWALERTKEAALKSIGQRGRP